MRFRLFLASLLTLLVGVSVSHAALTKYAVRTTNLTEYNFNSPVIEIMTGEPDASPSSTAVIDNDGGSGFPILTKLDFPQNLANLARRQPLRHNRHPPQLLDRLGRVA